MDSHVMIGAGLTPIPAKLVSKIEAGEFVDMAELLPDKFGIAKNQPGQSMEHHRLYRLRVYIIYGNTDTRSGSLYAKCAFKHICWYCCTDLGDWIRHTRVFSVPISHVREEREHSLSYHDRTPCSY